MVLKSSAARGRDIKFSGLPAQIDAFGFGHRNLLSREGGKRHSTGAVLRLPLARSKRSSRPRGRRRSTARPYRRPSPFAVFAVIRRTKYNKPRLPRGFAAQGERCLPSCHLMPAFYLIDGVVLRQDLQHGRTPALGAQREGSRPGAP